MHMPLHDLYAADRPREKMLLRGPHALTDAELIAVLLGSGRVGEPALALATRILDGVERSTNPQSLDLSNPFKLHEALGAAFAQFKQAAFHPI